MRRSIKLTLSLLLAWTCTATAWSQTTFQAVAPRMVVAGDPFQVQFNLNAPPDQGSFVPPSFAGLEVIAGPTPSQGQRVMFANGKTSSVFQFTYTYLVQAPTEGKVTIPAARIEVDGKSYSSRAVIIEVVAPGASTQGGSSGAASAGSSGSSGNRGSGSAALAADDILLRAFASSSNVYKGQPIRVTFKLYSRADIVGQESSKAPAFNGFWSQEIDTRGYDWQQETYNNKVYDTKVISEYLLFPQQTGTLEIEQLSLTLRAQIVTQSRRQSQFDDFFGGGPVIQQVSKTVSTSPVRITVRDLPAGAPAGFDGAVGQFKLEGGVPLAQITANSATSYHIRITGTGNLPLVVAPKVELPASFEQYPGKTTDNFAPSGTNIAGSRSFEIPFIARAEGDYTLPAVAFSYFDPQAGRYITLQVPERKITVTTDPKGGAANPGLVSGISKEDLQILGSDIRHIRDKAPGLTVTGSFLFGSWPYWLMVVALIGAFAFALVYMQKRIRQNNDKILVRRNKAHKIAVKRLKSAEKHLRSNDERAFYDEMLKALWGYMGDKLNLPVARLSKDNVREALGARNADGALVDRFIDIVGECEYAQYAPQGSARKEELYSAAVELISEFESKI